MKRKAESKIYCLSPFFYGPCRITRAADIGYFIRNQLYQLVEMSDGIMVAADHTMSIHAIDSENQDLKTMLMDILRHLSHLDHLNHE
ncbi:hypothetical protein TNIN_443271 [Trichonephila inaurata madagascariensis]|uniref:Uncharacterized protein n=1 Tax=Trichonephila inaurata madagascariensis TaxID=2747483 RepID=A0A8X6YRY8_9ARAC|nr:hypothetical protein TNIN_443271 [Trichonephila inaurata madagascariensis]